MPAGLVPIHRRLANIESILGVQGDSNSTAGVSADDGAGGLLLRCSKEQGHPIYRVYLFMGVSQGEYCIYHKREVPCVVVSRLSIENRNI